ncbi:MAG TPA: hypothetical protein VFK06_14705 [Candidatus Angelobacter sp.]|nr:hypothetical protein [Candidatus Angelobacter sp.]
MILREGHIFRNDRQTRATERALLRPLKGHIGSDSDGSPLFVFRYYRDTRGGPPSSGERTMLVSLLDLQSFSRRKTSNTADVDVEALSMLVDLEEFLEDGVVAPIGKKIGSNTGTKEENEEA